MMRSRMTFNVLLMGLFASVLAVMGTGLSTTGQDGRTSPWDDVALIQGVEHPDDSFVLVSGNICTSYRWLRRCAVAGYPARRDCGKAWCGLVGALGTKGGRVLYRADMPSSDRPGGYRKPNWMKGNRSGRTDKCDWGLTRSRKAAYILSRYGTDARHSNLESAAVDLAFTHSLCGKQKRWRVGGKATNRRLNAANLSTSQKQAIRDRARAILRDANTQHGPYRLNVTGTDVATGETATITARITTRTGDAAPGRRVVLRFSDGTTRDALTNSNGVAQWAFTMPTGTHEFRVRATGLEQHRLLRQNAKNAHGARLMIAGRTHAIARNVVITTKARPSLTVASGNAKIPASFTGTITYTGSAGGDERTATYELLGPWSSASNASCGSNTRQAGPTTGTISADGTYDLPKWAPRTGARYYMYRVTVSGDANNEPARACSSPILMRKATPQTPRSETLPSAGRTFDVGEDIAPARFEYLDGWGSGRREATIRLWGPFPTRSQSTCTAPSGMKARERTDALSANGRYSLPVFHDNTRRWRIRSGGEGWYRFEVLVKGDAANESTRVCGYPFKFE